MNRLLIGLTTVGFVVVVMTLMIDRIDAGTIRDFWPGAIFVTALGLAGLLLYVIKTSPLANQWRVVRSIRRWLARVDRRLQKDRRRPTDVNLP